MSSVTTGAILKLGTGNHKMHTYRIRFLQDAHAAGHRVPEIVKASFKVEAKTEGEAFEIGRRRFLSRRRVPDWSSYADVAEVHQLH